MDRFIYRDESQREPLRRENPVSLLLNSVFVKIILLIVSIFLLYNVGHSVDITVQKLNILERAKVEVNNLRVKNLELALLLDQMQSREYLEVQARDRLNFTGEREYVFVIPESVLGRAHQDVLSLLYGVGSEETREAYEIWREFLVEGI